MEKLSEINKSYIMLFIQTIYGCLYKIFWHGLHFTRFTKYAKQNTVNDPIIPFILIQVHLNLFCNNLIITILIRIFNHLNAYLYYFKMFIKHSMEKFIFIICLLSYNFCFLRKFWFNVSLFSASAIFYISLWSFMLRSCSARRSFKYIRWWLTNITFVKFSTRYFVDNINLHL